jgi:hypothetical protein
MPALVTPEDLIDFPGAPYAWPVVESASEAVRAEAGWHIAPSVTETLTVDSDGGRILFLPTMLLTEVSEVRDVSGETPRVITGWRKSRTGMLIHPGGWPTGFEVIEVDLSVFNLGLASGEVRARIVSTLTELGAQPGPWSASFSIPPFERADSPAKRNYLAVQLMYVSRNSSQHHDIYFKLVKDIVQAAPSTWPYVESINNHILTGEMYKALKDAKKLIAYEEELLANASRGSSLRKGGKTNL